MRTAVASNSHRVRSKTRSSCTLSTHLSKYCRHLVLSSTFLTALAPHNTCPRVLPHSVSPQPNHMPLRRSLPTAPAHHNTCPRVLPHNVSPQPNHMPVRRSLLTAQAILRFQGRRLRSRFKAVVAPEGVPEEDKWPWRITVLFQVPCCHVPHVAVDGPRVPRVVVGASGAVPLSFWISLGSVRVKRAQGGPACGGAGHYDAALGLWRVGKS